MKKIAAAVLLTVLAASPAYATLKVGDKAPEFSAKDQTGKSWDLKHVEGAKVVLLYFYPKDDTPGCTTEACNFRDDYSAYAEIGVTILGVSPDSPKSHLKFKQKHHLPFTLLADEDHAICEAYNVWGQKKFMGREYMGVLRTTFIIDPQGNIKKVFENVKPAEHSTELLAAIKA